jgi:outer membrane receptor for monomeric catechols
VRAAWQYQGANITSYADGTATAAGDTYFYAHSQIDASVIFNLTRDVSLQLQGLNLNNAVFGFFNGTRDAQFNIQREYYGRSVIFGAKYGF